MRHLFKRLFVDKQTKSTFRRIRLMLDCLEDRTVPDATFTEWGPNLQLVISFGNHVQIRSNDTSYTLSLTSGSWAGTDSPLVTGNSTKTLTVTTAGISAFSTIQLSDSHTWGNSVTFADSGTSRYFQNFEISLDGLWPTVVHSTFEGRTNFVGSAHLTLSSGSGIKLQPNSKITMQNGDLTLSGSGYLQEPTLSASPGSSIVSENGSIYLTGNPSQFGSTAIVLDHTQIQVLGTGSVSMTGNTVHLGAGLVFLGGSLEVANGQFHASLIGSLHLGGVIFRTRTSPQGVSPNNLDYTFINSFGTPLTTFANLPEGSIIDYGSGTYGKLTYHGGKYGSEVKVTKYVPPNTLIPQPIHPSYYPERQTTRVSVVGAGASGGPEVRVFNAYNQMTSHFYAYDPAFTGGVRVADGDVNNDGYPDVITAPASGGPAHIKVFDSVTGNVIRSFYSFDPSFTGGASIASADLNGDGTAEIIVGAGFGGSPHIKVFDGKSGNLLASFYAYGSAFAGGVDVATGDVTGDGIPDIITGTGPGSSPHVKVFDGMTFMEIRSFFAYDPTFITGVFVKATDLDGDGRAEIITGVGAGSAPLVKIFNGTNLTLRDSFYADSPQFLGGVRVGTADVDRMVQTNTERDGLNQVVLGLGPGKRPHIRLRNNQTFVFENSYYGFDPNFLGGVYLN